MNDFTPNCNKSQFSHDTENMLKLRQIINIEANRQ